MSRIHYTTALNGLSRRTRLHHHAPSRCHQAIRKQAFSSTCVRGSVVSDTIEDMVEKFKRSVRESNSEQYEGVTERGLRMLVFGKPGSGKGTLSARLVQDYDISFVSTGDVLRKEIAAKSEVGQKAEEVVASGGLVSDELMLEVVKAELDRLRGKSWIIDGFPRTLHQGELLDAVLNQENRPLNMIVHLNVPDSVIMARIAARWVHLPSGRVYNTTYSAPKVPGKDDVTGEPLVKRPDDTPETFSKRLTAYYESTAPLLQYFSQIYPESLFSISGSSSDEVNISPHQPEKTGIDARDHSATTSTSTISTPSETFTTQSPTSTSASASGHQTSNSHTASSDPNPNPESSPRIYPALEKLWPQLQALIEPYGLQRKRGAELDAHDPGVEAVRAKADDLKDPVEDEKVR